MNSAAPAWAQPSGYSTPLRALGLAALVLACSLLVYVIPTLSEQGIEGAFDAFSYAANLVSDAELARELQPFLAAYPSFLDQWQLPLYAVLLHGTLMVVPLVVLFRAYPRRDFAVVLAALAIPESAMFLGAVSKEGMAIVAVVAAIAGQALWFRNRPRWAVLASIYAAALAEWSRPGFGIPFGAAIMCGFIPALAPAARRRVYVLLAAMLGAGVWAILVGPFAEEYSEKYQMARAYLGWFEDNMGSESPLKAAVRSFFTFAFGSEEPSLTILVSIFLAALGKSLVYLLAVPLVSPPGFSNMPAQVWAVAWQMAASVSTIAMVVGLLRLRGQELTPPDRCRLTLGFALLFIVSISTAIFHVRYRAPAVVAILLAVWLVRRTGTRAVVPMAIAMLCAACWAIAATYTRSVIA